MKAIDADFSTVIGQFQYVIPYFQRSYVWKQEQIARFAEDMFYVYQKYAQFLQVQQQFEYFMGTIISKPAPNILGYQTLELIDGQQRITTFAVFFKAMSLVYGKPIIFDTIFKFPYGLINPTSILKLKSSAIDQPLMNNILSLTTNVALDKNGKSLPAGKKWSKRGMPSLYMAYNMFRDFIMDKLANGIQIIPDYIIYGVRFINMTLSTNDDEQVYFDNINSLGVRLTTSAIVKNYIFTHNSQGFTDYKTYWEPFFEGVNNKYWNGDDTNTNLDDFLFYYLQVKTFDNTINVASSDKSLYQRKDAVANHIKELCTKYMQNNKQLLLMDILQYASIYKKIVVENIGKLTTLNMCNTIDDRLARLGYLIKKLKVSTLIPYLLFLTYKNSANTNETMTILEYLESYLIRRNLIDANYKNDNKFFREVLIAKNVLNINTLKKELCGSNRTTDMPTDTDILNNMNNWDYEGDNETPKALLYMYELELCRRNNSHTIPREPDFYTLEHLMPQTLTPIFWPGPNQSIDHVYKIGNMGLLNQSLQSIIKNRSWNDKLNGYQGKPGIILCCSGLYSMNDVVNTIIWDNNVIETRTRNIIKDLINIWKA